ncbi:hypothetical protein G9A89_020780 [Geosiphon pyriformis]|nr:hypothetical protein G9A89_020780 [Geosiphon pyriformis]
MATDAKILAVVLKKILVGTLAEAVHAALSNFGIIKSIKMQLVGLWQKAVMEFEQLDQADLVTAEWSILIGKDVVHVAKSDKNKETWDKRDVHKALLYTLPVETNAHNIWDYIKSVGGKTCVIDRHLVSYAQARCAAVCFDFANSLNAVMGTMPVLRGANLHWSSLIMAKYAKCGNSGHTSLDCAAGGKIPSSSPQCRILSDSDKGRLATIYARCSASVAHPVSFGSASWAQIVVGFSFLSLPVQNGLLSTGSSLEVKPAPQVFLALNDRFATLKHSLASLTEHVDKLAKRLDTPELTVSQLSLGCQPLVTLSSQNQGADIVMSESSGVATSGETVVGAVLFDNSVITKMEETLRNLLVTIMSFSAKMENGGSVPDTRSSQ